MERKLQKSKDIH